MSKSLISTGTLYLSRTYRRSEEDEEKPGGNWNLGKVAEENSLAKTNEGRKRLVKFGKFSDQNI